MSVDIGTECIAAGFDFDAYSRPIQVRIRPKL